MASKQIKCIKSVGKEILCKYCEGYLIKHGLSPSGGERYKCKACSKTQMKVYKNKACAGIIDQEIVDHLKEGCGIRSISRLLYISISTVSKRILKISKTIKPPHIFLGKEYEMDEIKTFVQRKTKHIWVAYAIQKDSKQVIAFVVGRRTKRTLNVVIETLILSKAKTIFTDKLNIYKSLIDQNIHSTNNRGTNYIERKHLTIRTHLKRLNRKTICFSRSTAMLAACLKIYFWY